MYACSFNCVNSVGEDWRDELGASCTCSGAPRGLDGSPGERKPSHESKKQAKLPANLQESCHDSFAEPFKSQDEQGRTFYANCTTGESSPGPEDDQSPI